MKYFFAFIAFVVALIVINTIDLMAYRFFHVYLTTVEEVLIAVAFLVVIIIINKKREIAAGRKEK